MTPSNSTPIRRLLALEAALNIFGATSMLLFPHHLIHYSTIQTRLTAAGLPLPSQTLSTPGPAAAQLLQLLGGMFYGLTLPMLWALPNGKGAGERRRTVYVFLLAGEVCLVCVLVWQALGGGGEAGAGVGAVVGAGAGAGDMAKRTVSAVSGGTGPVGAFTKKVLLGAAVNLGVFAAIRAGVMVWRKRWFVDGDGDGDGGRGEGKANVGKAE